jgi:hypothetical protein
MATAANGREEKRLEQHETRIPLTPTGLLMEGLSTQISTSLDLMRIRSFYDWDCRATMYLTLVHWSCRLNAFVGGYRNCHRQDDNAMAISL